MTAQDFIPKPYKNEVEHGKVAWESPSNIALVKYWGKQEPQIPKNPSLSFTLSHCKTITSLEFSKKENDDKFSIEVFLEGVLKDSFKPKIETFFNRVEAYLPFLKAYHFKIDTKNTFPHSSGIASSASGMSALALGLMSLEQLLMSTEMTDAYRVQKASFLARLGSGSACRSIEGPLIVWGQTKHIAGSSNLFGVPYPYPVHENFKNYQDTILLIDKGEKQVSSTVGHNLMNGHPFAEKRFLQAHDNTEKLKSIFSSGDLEAFINLIESEALTLHAMMMTSEPHFILMKPNTLQVLNKIAAFRKETRLPIGFTLDAGANVHVLYPESEKTPILKFIESELVAFCKNGEYICDQVGVGAVQLNY